MASSDISDTCILLHISRLPDAHIRLQSCARLLQESEPSESTVTVRHPEVLGVSCIAMACPQARAGLKNTGLESLFLGGPASAGSLVTGPPLPGPPLTELPFLVPLDCTQGLQTGAEGSRAEKQAG